MSSKNADVVVPIPLFCQLCTCSTQDVGKLLNSHVIPRFMLLKTKEKGRATQFDSQQRRIFQTQEDWKEPMLCAECEHRLKVYYEDFLNETLFLHRKKPILFESSKLLFLSASNTQFSLALLSIFWRAIVSTLPEFHRIVLPDYIKDELRTWVYNGKAFKTWDKLISIKLVQLINHENVVISFLVPPFFRNNTPDGYFEFVFIFAGFCVTFTIPPSKKLSAKRDFALRPGSNIVRIPKVHYSEIPELNELVSEMLELKDSQKK